MVVLDVLLNPTGPVLMPRPPSDRLLYDLPTLSWVLRPSPFALIPLTPIRYYAFADRLPKFFTCREEFRMDSASLQLKQLKVVDSVSEERVTISSSFGLEGI